MKIWVIQASFDNEVVPFYGSADECVLEVERWSFYRWDEKNVSDEYIYLSGYDIDGDGEIGVVYTAKAMDITDQVAKMMYNLFDKMEINERLSFANMLALNNSIASTAIFHKVRSGTVISWPEMITREVAL